MKDKIGKYLIQEKIRYDSIDHKEDLPVYGVSNIEGITETQHKRSKDLSKYIVIRKNSFAYNPYRINVGSIGLTPSDKEGLVSPAYVVFRSDENKLLPELLLDYLKSEEGLRQIRKYSRGTVRKALRFEDIGKIEMSIPDIAKQRKILMKKDAIDQKVTLLLSSIVFQKAVLQNFQKQILYDAISGKLSEEWRKENPNVESAEILLEEIKKEKVEKKKSLLRIDKTGIPFEIPKGWTCCKLGDILKMHYGRGLTKNERIPSGKYPVYGSNGIVGYHKAFLTDKRSIIVGRKGSAGAINISLEPSWTTDVAYYIEEIPHIDFYFQYFLLLSLNIEELGKGIKPGLNRNEFYELEVKLPPLKEQKYIVSRIEYFFAKLDRIEELNTGSQEAIKLLSQVVTIELLEA